MSSRIHIFLVLCLLFLGMSEAVEVDASISNVESNASQTIAPHQHHQHQHVAHSLVASDADHSVSDDDCVSCCHIPVTYPTTPMVGMALPVRCSHKIAPAMVHLASLSTPPLIRPPIA